MSGSRVARGGFSLSGARETLQPARLNAVKGVKYANLVDGFGYELIRCP